MSGVGSMGNAAIERRRKLDEALALMGHALELLDQAEAPGEIGAHLDMAICRLGEETGREAAVSEPEQPDEEPPAEDNCAWPSRPAA